MNILLHCTVVFLKLIKVSSFPLSKSLLSMLQFGKSGKMHWEKGDELGRRLILSKFTKKKIVGFWLIGPPMNQGLNVNSFSASLVPEMFIEYMLPAGIVCSTV